MKRRIVIDKAIGETRAAVFEGKRLVELHTRRWTDSERPRLGDIYAGRVRKIEKSLGAAFIDLGGETDGFFKFTTSPNAPHLSEGARVKVEVSREPEDGKGANVKLLELLPNSEVGRLEGQDLSGMLKQRFPDAVIDEARVNTLMDAVESELAIAGGGTIAIERTRALTAIDIDSGQAVSPFAVAKAACPMIAEQLRLRGIGGLVAIDFPNLRQKRQREEIQRTLEHAFEGDPNIVKFAPLSRFGVIEMTRSRIGRSLDEIVLCKTGDWTIETEALEALRALEREGRSSPGGQLTLAVPQPVYDWLEGNYIDWRTPMKEKLGARFSLKTAEKQFVASDR